MGDVAQKKIGLGNYKFGNKNNWRRWQWNRIKEFYPYNKNIKDAVVLYLPGNQDLDRGIAKSIGIKDYNLIACDTDKINIGEFRKNKKLIIQGDISDIVCSYDGYPKIDIIIADFCCGFTLNVNRFLVYLLLSKGFSENCILSLNLLRGRDKYSNTSRSLRKTWVKIVDDKLSEKHRSILAIFDAFYYCCFKHKNDIEINAFEDYMEHRNRTLEYWKKVHFNIWMRQIGRILCGWSYRSNNIIMDSAICMIHGVTRVGFELRNDRHFKLKNQISAVKAHRTMKMKSLGII